MRGRGSQSDGPFIRESDRAGTGWVRETLNHQYADAQARGNPVSLHVAESTGAVSASFDAALRALGKESRAATTHDSTVYGVARSSPRTFYAHHIAAHSHAVVMADAVTVHTCACALAFRLSIGMPA